MSTSSPRFFGKTEQLSRSELEALQLHKLRRLLERAYANNQFYRERWTQAKVAPDDIKTLEDFRNRVPFVTKEECLADQLETPPLGRRLGIPPDLVRQIHLTSGSSGIGQEAWGLSQSDVELSATLWMYQYHWMGLEPGDVAFYSIPTAFFANGLSADYAGRKMGMAAMNLFGIDKNLVWRLMEQFQPQYLYGTMTLPSTLDPNEPMPRERLHRLKAISGALMGFETMKRVSEAWGAAVYEMYGSTQASSIVGATCEQTAVVDDRPGVVHFLEGHFIVECLNRDTGQPAEPDEDCEIFLTTLDREASPAIRFRMHDKAVFAPAESCRCGRPYHGYRACTIGRWDEMMKVKGINIWPSMMDELVMSIPEIREYRGFVESDETERETMRLVVDLDDDVPAERRAAVLEEITSKIKGNTFVTPRVEAAVEPIPPAALKPKRWTDSRREGSEPQA